MLERSSLNSVPGTGGSGLVLLMLEVVVPGIFLLWFGIAALIVGALSLLFWEALLVWQVQVLVFLILPWSPPIVGPG